MLLAAAAAAVDAAFAVVAHLSPYRRLAPFDRLWVAVCIAGHIGVYLSYTMPVSACRRLRTFADYVLWCAMITAPLLRSKSLLAIAVVSMAGVGVLYYTHNRVCILTGAQWSPLAEWLYFPMLAFQLLALAWRL